MYVAYIHIIHFGKQSNLKSPASWLFTQAIIKEQIKENIKLSFTLLAFVREFPGDRWIPRTKGQ